MPDDKHTLRILRKGAKLDTDVFRPGHDLLNYAGPATQKLVEVLALGWNAYPGWLKAACRANAVTPSDLADAAPAFAAAMRMIRTASLNIELGEAFKRAGFDQKPAPVKLVYYAFFGQLMLAGVWSAAHADADLPQLAPDPRLDPVAAVASAARLTKELP